MTDQVGDGQAEEAARVSAVYSFFAASRPEDVEVVERPPRPRWRFVAILMTVLLLAAALPIADHQASVLGGRIWAPPIPEPTVAPSGLTYCGEIKSVDQRRIERAANEMRRTAEAANLLATLVENEICIGVEDLSFNSGYTIASTRFGRPIVNRIIIDKDILDYLAANEAAAILVHEATHAARWLDRTDCRFTDECQVLENGVVVEEEVAAHSAEVRFWTAINGPQGTQEGYSWRGSAGARYLNELVKVANQGPDAFRAYVIEIRSDPREGEGIDLNP